MSRPPSGRPTVERLLDGLERRYWLMGKIAPLTPSAVAHIEGPLTERAVRAALDAVQRRHPLLNVRVDERPDGPWFIPGAPPIPLRVVIRAEEHEWTAVANEDINRPFATWPGPLVQATLLLGRGAHELVLTYHHICMDGLGSYELMRDVIRFAGEALAGRSPPAEALLPQPPMGSLLPASARGPEARALLEREVARFTDLKARAPARLPVERAVPPAQRRTLLLPRSLDAGATARLAERAKKEGATVHAALCAAMYLAVARELRLEKPATLGLSTPANLRGQLAQPAGEGVGWYAFGLPIFHDVAADTPLWNLARAIRTELHHGDLPARRLAVLAYIDEATARTPDAADKEAQGAEDFGVTTMSVTNLGRVEAFPEAGGLRATTFYISAPMNIGGPVVALAAATYAGRLLLHLSHPWPLVGRERAERIAGEAVRLLQTGA